MEVLIIYALFAVTTSLTALYELVSPVIALRKSENKPTLSVPLIYIIFLCLNILAAPAVFFSCIIPSFGERFRKSLYKGLYSED